MTKQNPIIDIRPDHWNIVQGILQKHVPQYEVWAFGSRATWKAKEFSDLDLAIISDQPLSLDISASLRDDFSESDLPWKVDVVDWATTSESFRKIIERDGVVVQATAKGLGGGSEWKEQPFAEAPLEIIDGDRGVNYPKQDDFSLTGHCLFLNAGNVTTTGFNFSDTSFISNNKDANLRKGKAQRDDIVLTTRGTVGNVALYDASIPYNHVRINSGMVLLRADKSKLLPKYLYQFVRSNVFKERVAALTTGSAQPQLPIRDMKRIELPLPPIAEQRAIAHILGTLDDKIELNRKQNETLEAMARALFKAWFVDFDPVRAKLEGRWQRGQSLPGLPAHLYDLFPDRLVESELGEIPKGWELTSLSKFSSLNPESWTKRTLPEEILYIDLSNTKWGRVESVTKYEAADAPSRAQRILRPLDTIVGTVRPGNGSYALICDEYLTGSTGFAVLRPLRREYSEFVYLSATAHENIKRLSNLADGGAYPAVRPEVVSATQVPRIGEYLINEFSRQVSSMFAGIASNERDSHSLAHLRDTLLPKLISGELQVFDANQILQNI